MQAHTPNESGPSHMSSHSPSDEGYSLAPEGHSEPATSLSQEIPAAEPAVSPVTTLRADKPEQPSEQNSSTHLRAEQAVDEGNARQAILRPGTVHEAVVDTVHPDAVLVHLPRSQREGFAPAKDLRQLGADFRATLEEGTHFPVRVLKDPGHPADVVVSFDQETASASSSPDQDWARAEQLLTDGEEFEAQVTGVNSGGVLVAFGQVEGFVPDSHLERSGSGNHDAKAELVGQTISLTVLEIDRPNRRLVLSQRQAEDHDQEQILSRLEKGQVHTGVVRNLVDFGAFVDLGGVDGLVHISELDWRHVDHPSDVLTVGEEVEVYVLDVDRERSRISLSRKYLLPRPWDEAAEAAQEPRHRASMVSDQVLRQHRT